MRVRGCCSFYDSSSVTYVNFALVEYRCKQGHFTCASTGTCIPPAWVCDQDSDCSDGSDEQKCGERTDIVYFRIAAFD